MAGKTQRTVNSPGIGKKEGKGKQNCVADNTDAACAIRNFTPLLVDSNQGARILGISLSHYYKFLRRNSAISPVMIGSLHMWRRKDLLRLTGKSSEPQPTRDILIDAQEIATLCSISRSMVYKLNEQRLLPEPILDGRTLRWSYQAIEEWIDEGCPGQKGKWKNTGRTGK